MKYYCLIISLLIGCIFVSPRAIALVSSNGIGGGDWTSPLTWDTGVPICGDSIHILSGDEVTVAVQQDYSACGTPMVLTIDGTLRFPSNGPKLRLPAGSTIIVNTGGLITAPGGGNGNKISIGPDWVWEKIDGDVNGYTCFGACGPLPIEILSLEALPHDRSICINWITLTESNNDYFTIERSTDAVNFSEVIQIDGAGNSNWIIEYSVKDTEPLSGITYYRLKQTDFDGTYSYSPLVSVEAYFPRFANPILTSEDLVITLSNLKENDQVHIELRNMDAELNQLEHFTAMQDGEQSFTLNTGGRLVPGLYFISISSASGFETKKLLIQ